MPFVPQKVLVADGPMVWVRFQFFAAGIRLSLYGKVWQPKWNGCVRAGVFMAGLASWLIASIFCKINADAQHLSTIPQAIRGWLFVLIGVVLSSQSLYGALY